MTADESRRPADETNLGLLLFIPYRAMEAAVLAELRAHGHDLPLQQARVFQRITPEGSRLSELAQAAQLSKQTVGSILDQLEKAGYVDRVPDPRDARARLVRITSRGQQLVDLSLPVVRRVEAAWAAHLGPVRTRQLRQALDELRMITDPFVEPRPSGDRTSSRTRARGPTLPTPARPRRSTSASAPLRPGD